MSQDVYADSLRNVFLTARLQAEKDKLLKALLSQHRQSLGVAFWASCTDTNSDEHNQVGPANWLDLDLA